jgi:hypothetical protein
LPSSRFTIVRGFVVAGDGKRDVADSKGGCGLRDGKQKKAVSEAALRVVA